MVATRSTTAGTRPKAQPLLAKPSKAAKAAKTAKVAKMKAEKEAERAAAKAVNDAKKAAVKAEKDAKKAAAKVSKVANTKNGTKGAKRTTAAKTKAIKATKTAKKAKATKSSVSAATVKASTKQYDEDEDEDSEDNEESEENNYEPQAKRRKVKTLAPNVEIGRPTFKRPASKIGKWAYMEKLHVPEGVEDEFHGPLPPIYIGGAAPQPRWVIIQNENSENIKVPSKRHASKASSGRTGGTRDFGELQWTFEEGDFKNWTGLEYPALYELAYLCLEYTLTHTKLREQIYDSLAQGPLLKAVAIDPALPPMPITRHFATGTSEQSSRKSSNAAFYFPNYDRPSMAVRPRDDHMARPYPHAVASNIYNRPRSEEWPTASRSASPDLESERGGKQGSEESHTAEPRKSQDPEGTYSEPAAPAPFRNDEKVSRDSLEGVRVSTTLWGTIHRSSHTQDDWLSHTISEDGSIFGDGDDVQTEPHSARDSREQSPDSPLSGSGSNSEVSASSKTSEPSKVNIADDNSAQSTNNMSPVSHDGLFSPGQIERYYRKKQKNFERLGGVGHREASKRKRRAQLSLEDAQKEARKRELEIIGAPKSSKRIRMEPSSIPSPSAIRRKTAAEITVDKVMSFARAGQDKRDEIRAAAAEKISDRPPVALKKTIGNQAGARPQAGAPSPEIPPNLQDRFLEQTRIYLNDPIRRARHFPDPITVRRARVWAGEELVGHEIKPTVDTTLPPWAERHRPFSQWQDPIGVIPTPAARTKPLRSKRRSKGRGKRRLRPASAEEQSVISARWSSFR
ncbi:uncharacterized protein N7518_004226 [Penicillium psychrosexuale]|uniref:uncharacterized protein n=1 Tax=Penicillium psychrosexuale TaxID=1002107 RepID=UPI002544F950|nr:uncharacterized protein N7518_004226 [Penicillium psychrosexuale]KAJ5795686.1 hypothetical protein N7518_004226 [Penicillium psychrosexuale]